MNNSIGLENPSSTAYTNMVTQFHNVYKNPDSIVPQQEYEENEAVSFCALERFRLLFVVKFFLNFYLLF